MLRKQSSDREKARKKWKNVKCFASATEPIMMKMIKIGENRDEFLGVFLRKFEKSWKMWKYGFERIRARASHFGMLEENQCPRRYQTRTQINQLLY